MLRPGSKPQRVALEGSVASLESCVLVANSSIENLKDFTFPSGIEISQGFPFCIVGHSILPGRKDLAGFSRRILQQQDCDESMFMPPPLFRKRPPQGQTDQLKRRDAKI